VTVIREGLRVIWRRYMAYGGFGLGDLCQRWLIEIKKSAVRRNTVCFVIEGGID